MKHLLTFALIFILTCVSCNPTKNMYNGPVMYKPYSKVFSYSQFDSICNVDSISSSLSDWEWFIYIDAETNTMQTEYSYIKALGDIECIYVLEITNADSVHVIKRIIK